LAAARASRIIANYNQPLNVALGFQQGVTSVDDQTLAKDKWYWRYLHATFLFTVAFFAFKFWLEGVRASGMLLLLVNPVVPIILAVGALIIAWELALIFIAISIIYFTYIGLSALPISVAIIIGFSLVALAVYKKKA